MPLSQSKASQHLHPSHHQNNSESRLTSICFFFIEYGLKAEQKNAHAKTLRCLDGKVILCVFVSLRLCVSEFFRLALKATANKVSSAYLILARNPVIRGLRFVSSQDWWSEIGL